MGTVFKIIDCCLDIALGIGIAVATICVAGMLFILARDIYYDIRY